MITSIPNWLAAELDTEEVPRRTTDPTDFTGTLIDVSVLGADDPREAAAEVELIRERSRALRRAALEALQWPEHTCIDLNVVKRIVTRQARRRAAGRPVEREALAEAAARLQRVAEAQEHLRRIAGVAEAAGVGAARARPRPEPYPRVPAGRSPAGEAVSLDEDDGTPE